MKSRQCSLSLSLQIQIFLCTILQEEWSCKPICEHLLKPVCRSVPLQWPFKITLIPNLSVRASYLYADIHPTKFVVSVNKGHQHYRVLSIVVRVKGTSVLWTSYGYMFAIESTKGLEEMPFCLKLFSYNLPLIRFGGCIN